MGVDLSLAGIYAKVKLLCREKLYLLQLTKVHKKKENNAFDFCIIQISQSYCFYKYIYRYVFIEVCRIQKIKKKEKGLTKLICSFGNVTDQREGVKEATIIS